jgi:hypothetical protein
VKMYSMTQWEYINVVMMEEWVPQHKLHKYVDW